VRVKEDSMSVIFIKNRRTTESKDFDKYRKSETSLVLTNAKLFEEFSIELTLGDLYDDDLSEERAIMYALENDEVALHPKSSVVVEVAEGMRVPNNMYGIVMPKGHILLEQGILMASTKIEPSYDGKLRILVFNTSRRKRTIRKGTVIASAVFFCTEKTLGGEALISREPVIRKRKGLAKVASDFVRQDVRRFVIVLAMVLTSSLVAALVTYFLTKQK
jgi:deoxycytidine triphosphate deaminase